MKKVFAFNLPSDIVIDDYVLSSLDPSPYFSNDMHGSLRDLINGGRGRWNRMHNFGYAHEIDTLYREKNSSYMRYVSDFLDKFNNHDIFVMSTYNPIHPEIIYKYLKNKTKILGFIDDPYSSYRQGIPNLWAFDGAFYISPSYGEDILFKDQMTKWGVENHKWFPLSPKTIQLPKIDDSFFYDRNIDVAYVGSYVGGNKNGKVERLTQLKKHFGERFKVYGRWPLQGMVGFINPLFKKPFYPHKVRSIDENSKYNLFLDTKISFNMHVSAVPTETGNYRMYETPYFGMMQICDKAGANAHEQIYTPDTECVYYDNTDEAIDLIEYYLTHDEERIKIAKAGFERTKKDYNWEKNWKELLDWAWSLKH